MSDLRPWKQLGDLLPPILARATKPMPSRAELKIKASLPHKPSNEAIIEAMVARIGRAYDAYDQAQPPSGKGGLTNAERLAKRERVIQEILADPEEKAVVLASRAGCADTTIGWHRKRLKAEGRIP